MLVVTKILHLFALGLWFGSTCFFTFVVGLSLFDTFRTIAQSDSRPGWFPLAPRYDKDPATWKKSQTPSIFNTAEEVRAEQGSRAAGAAVRALFGWYFLLQAVCAVAAVATSATWLRADRPGRAVAVARVAVLALALVTVAAGWLLERRVSGLRADRNAATDAVLQGAPEVPAADMQWAAEARAQFGRFHGYSLMLNFLTLLLVTVAMALAAALPARPG
jgi:acyl phosphate:glycerol-3-phosphate acyltransferase